MDNQQLQSLCQEWQKTLRLAEWDIKVEFAPAKEMPSFNHFGFVRWETAEKAADIKIVFEEDATRIALRPYDAELILVHELLHILWSALDRWQQGSMEEDHQEFAINATAGALIKLKRQSTQSVGILEKESSGN